MKTAQVTSSAMSHPSKMKFVCFRCVASWMVITCWAITDSTSMSMRLNSSKQAQAPEDASPLKNFPIASAFPRSFVVSVFPVPAGPAGAPPRQRCMALVRKQRLAPSTSTASGRRSTRPESPALAEGTSPTPQCAR
eukprot:761318-Hanusia_phi.AAC.2